MQEKLVGDFKENSVKFKFEPVRDNKRLLFQIHQMGNEITGRNYFVDRYGMDSFLFSYIRKGHTNMSINDVVYKANEGSFIFLDCYPPHKSWVDEPIDESGTTANFIYIHIYPTESLRNMFAEFYQTGIIFNFQNDLGFVDMVSKFLKDYAEGTYDENEASIEIYKFLIRFSKNAKEKIVQDDAIPFEIKSVISYLISNYNKRISVEDCAKRVNLTPNYLEFLFKNHMKMPILKYLQHYRFQKAIDLLENTNLNIKEIANQIGLYDAQAFIRLFKQKTKLTPTKYRKQFKNK